MTAATTEAPATTDAGSASAKPPKKKPNPIKSAERQIAKAIKSAAESQGPEDQKALFVKGLKGLERLIQTIDQITDPSNPPGPDTAWGKVVSLGDGQDRVANLLALGPQDVF